MSGLIGLCLETPPASQERPTARGAGKKVVASLFLSHHLSRRPAHGAVRRYPQPRRARCPASGLGLAILRCFRKTKTNRSSSGVVTDALWESSAASLTLDALWADREACGKTIARVAARDPESFPEIRGACRQPMTRWPSVIRQAFRPVRAFPFARSGRPEDLSTSTPPARRGSNDVTLDNGTEVRLCRPFRWKMGGARIGAPQHLQPMPGRDAPRGCSITLGYDDKPGISPPADRGGAPWRKPHEIDRNGRSRRNCFGGIARQYSGN